MTITRWFGRLATAAGLTTLLLGGTALPAAAGRVRGSDGSVLRLDSIVQTAIGQGATPGAAVAIGTSGGDVVIRTYGRTDWSRGAPAVTDSTLYDLASLTKVLAATPGAMLLVQQGRLDLDAPISRYLPWWPRDGAKGQITARDLLLHRAGFPAGEALRGIDRADRIRSLAARPLAYAPRTQTIYSDISMVMLAAVIEQITGERLDAFVTRNIYAPLEMRDTRFTPRAPLEAEPFELWRIAPTGPGTVGAVQDPIAARLDGISGNAGLFSSIRDVARYAQLMLVGSEGMRTPVLTDSTIQLFAARPNGSERALGWDGPSSTLWAPYFSDASFGHTGYTGTSIWIDPHRDVFVVLLTNRTDPSTSNQKHMALRRAVNALVENDFAGAPPSSNRDLGVLAAALLKDIRLQASDIADERHGPAVWYGPSENGVGPIGAWGLGLGLLLALGILGATALMDRLRPLD